MESPTVILSGASTRCYAVRVVAYRWWTCDAASIAAGTASTASWCPAPGGVADGTGGAAGAGVLEWQWAPRGSCSPSLDTWPRTSSTLCQRTTTRCNSLRVGPTSITTATAPRATQYSTLTHCFWERAPPSSTDPSPSPTADHSYFPFLSWPDKGLIYCAFPGRHPTFDAFLPSGRLTSGWKDKHVFQICNAICMFIRAMKDSEIWHY